MARSPVGRWVVLLAIGLTVATAAVVWASHVGLGVPVPVKSPLSIREHSARAGGVRGHGLLVGK